MKRDEHILSMFPAIFFILGLFLEAFVNLFEGWVTWIIILFGIIVYGLFFYWFEQQYRKEIKSK